MKKIITLLILFFVTISINAQNKSREQHREKIKSLKVAFITQELNMTTDLAEKFWPIYNRYECLKMDLHEREHVELNGIENISEAKAKEMLKEYLAVEQEEYAIKKELFSDLKQIISAKDIIRLHKLEEDFNKKLLKEYKARKAAARAKNQ